VVVVEMSKTERDVGHHPRSQSIYGDIVHQTSGQEKHAGQASPFIPTSKQDINKCDGNHATQNVQEQQDLSSMQMEQRNNGKTTYHTVENQNTNTECVPEDPSDVICAKKFL